MWSWSGKTKEHKHQTNNTLVCCSPPILDSKHDIETVEAGMTHKYNSQLFHSDSLCCRLSASHKRFDGGNCTCWWVSTCPLDGRLPKDMCIPVEKTYKTPSSFHDLETTSTKQVLLHLDSPANISQSGYVQASQPSVHMCSLHSKYHPG